MKITHEEEAKRHLILNRDILNIELVEKPKLIIIDPPYFVLPKGKKHANGIDNFSWDHFKDMDDFIRFTNEWFSHIKTLIDDGYIYIFWSSKHLKEGLNIFSPDRVLIWHYRNLTNGGNGQYAWDYEPIFMVKIGDAPKIKPGKHSSVFQYTKPQSNFKEDKLIHPTQKPKELYKKIIELSSKEGDLVADFMGGSGTIISAAIETNRRSIYNDSNKQYADLARERIKTIYNVDLTSEEEK